MPSPHVQIVVSSDPDHLQLALNGKKIVDLAYAKGYRDWSIALSDVAEALGASVEWVDSLGETEENYQFSPQQTREIACSLQNIEEGSFFTAEQVREHFRNRAKTIG